MTSQVAAKLNEALPSGIYAELQHAKFVEGRGFEVRDLVVGVESREQPARRPLVQVANALIHLPVTAPELVLGKSAQPSAIKVQRARIELERDSDGKWNFDPLLNCFANPASPLDVQPIPVDFVDCQVSVTDRTQQPPRYMELNEIQIRLRPVQDGDRTLIRLAGSLAGESFSELQFDALIDPHARSWSARLAARDARLTTRLFRLLPYSLRQLAEETEMLGGTLELEGSAAGRFDDLVVPQWTLAGSLRGFTVKHPDLPCSLSRTHVQFRLDQLGLEVTEGRGYLDDSPFRLNYVQQGWDQIKTWKLTGRLENFAPRRELLRWCPEAWKNCYDDFSPRGRADLEFLIGHDGKRPLHDIRATTHDMAFTFSKLPYPVEHCHGNATWIDDHLVFELDSNDRGQNLHVNGKVVRPGRQATFRINLRLDGSVPLDDRLFQSLRTMPALQDTVLAFRPSGRISGRGTITKSLPTGEPLREFDIDLIQCNVRHTLFDYPIHNVNGKVLIRGDESTFQRVTGASGLAEVECNGNWNPRQGLNLRFICSKVPLNESLRRAVPSMIRDIWADLRPQGVVSLLRVDLRNPIDEPLDVSVSADLTAAVPGHEEELPLGAVSVTPVWFPYPIRGLSGKVEIGDGRIVLTEMRGQHDRTWMRWNGTGEYSDSDWEIRLLNMLVGQIVVNEDLLMALPDPLGPAIRQLQFRGALMMNGELQIRGSAPQDSRRAENVQWASYRSEDAVGRPPTNSSDPGAWRTGLKWNLRFDVDQAEMTIGLPIENVFGSVRLEGQYDGERAACWGALGIHSLTFYDAQITNIQGPLWIDSQSVLVGTAVGDRLAPQSITPITGQLFGGTLRLDAYKSLVGTGPFEVQATLEQGDLNEAVQDLAPRLDDVEGKASAIFRFQGDARGLPSYRGGGRVECRNAQIYELPVMVALLKILYVKDLNRVAFDSSNVDFSIQGDRFNLDRIELIGDAISLIGEGMVNLDRDIDLNFYTVMGRGRFYIPGLSELYRASSKRIVRITVDGTLDDPRTQRHNLLDESMRQLFETPTVPPAELKIELGELGSLPAPPTGGSR